MDTHFLQVSYSHTGTQYIDITFSDMKLMVYVWTVYILHKVHDCYKKKYILFVPLQNFSAIFKFVLRRNYYKSNNVFKSEH